MYRNHPHYDYQCHSAQLVPNKTKANEEAPDYRHYAGGAEIGAAWQQDSKDGEKPYLAVKLDDPSFAAPIRAAFFPHRTKAKGVLVWSRNPPASWAAEV